ncbi:hypothetical protein Tco_0516673 [Tanacetum coccineum]
MNQNHFEPNPIYNSSYSGFDQPPQYSINHQDQQRISDVHNGWDKIDELQNELLQMIPSICEKFLQQKQLASIDQSPLQEMSLQEMEDLKQHYLDEMLSLSNDLQIKDYRNKKIDIRFRRECEDMIVELKSKFNGMSIEINKKKELQYLEQVAKLGTYTTEPSRHFNCTCCDYEESTIPLNGIDSQTPPSIEITLILPTLEPEDMGNEELSTIPEKESDEFINSSVEELVPIPSESEDTIESDSDCDLTLCDDFSPINVYEEQSVTFYNPLFDSNDDFTSSDDESLSDEDDIECKDSYDSNLDESTFLVTPLFDSNEDECFTPSDDVELLLYHDSSTPMISVVSILEGFTNKPPLKENDDLFDLESKKNEWKKILYDDPIDDLIFDPGGDVDEIDAFLDIDIPTNIKDDFYDSEGDVLYLESLLSDDTTPSPPLEVFLDRDPRSLRDINDLKIMVKIFDPRIHEIIFSPTYVSLPFEYRHYLTFTYVIRIFFLTSPICYLDDQTPDLDGLMDNHPAILESSGSFLISSKEQFNLRGLKKRKLSKDAKPTTGPKKKDSRSGSSKGTKSQPKSSKKSVQSEEPVFEVADSDIPQDQEENLGDNEDEPRNETASRRPALKLLKGTHSNFNKLEYDFEECYKALSKKLDWENPEGGDYPFNISKPLPLITRGERQRVPFEYFINNDLKYLQGGVSTMTYTMSTTKTKAAQYDLPSIEDMVPNIWSPVKVAYDRYALWGISYWREQRDDVADFVIALNMFTRSLVIQKRVEDLQLGVESYQKKINVTKPDTTRPDLRKRHPYTPYKDPQGFIYVDDYKRNRLMRSDELYKFSDGTLTRLLSSLEDITKNIDMEYLPKRRWSTLEKKRAHFMIKDINKLLKERRMMRSLEKFVGGRLYGTDLRLLQRTI